MTTMHTTQKIGTNQPAVRDLRLDALKGFLIILVLVGHSSFTASIAQPAGSFMGSLITRLLDYLPPIYYFHMALFFSVAAVHTAPIGWRKYLRRMSLLVIPLAFWVCWPVFSYFIANYPLNPHRPALIPFVTGPVWHWLKEQLLRLPGGSWNGVGLFWFLPAMASFVTLCILEAYLERLCSRFAGGKALVRVLLAAAWVVLVSHAGAIAKAHVAGKVPWGLDVAAYLLPIGVFHRWLYQNEDLALRVPNALLVAAIIVGEILLTVFEPLKTYSAFAYRIDFAQFSVAMTPLGVLGFILLVTGIFIVFLKMRPGRILAWIGFYSLPIYLMHLPWLDGDPFKAAGMKFIPASFAPGTIEGIHYIIRVGIAIAIPMAVSTLFAVILPFGRYLGFVAPAPLLAARDRFLQRAKRRVLRSKSTQAP